MQATYQGTRTLRLRMFDYFDEHGDQMPTRDVVQHFGCADTTAQRYRKRWQVQQLQLNGECCRRCEFYGWKKSPVWDGLCLWCRIELAGLNLAQLARDWGWARILEEMSDGRLPDATSS